MSTPRSLGNVHDRADLPDARRIVVKVGSSSLTTAAGGLDRDRLCHLVDTLVEQRGRGTQVVLVSSGAIAAGLAPLGLTRRPRDLATQQAAASVGQGVLFAAYDQAFGRHRVMAAQVLLTGDDMIRRQHYRNAQRTFNRLLQLGVLPVVNENDTVVTDEIRLGDNDRLAALVAHLVHADAMVLLSDVDGLYTAPPSRPDAVRIARVRDERDLAGVAIGSAGSAGIGTGGMATKVTAARMAASSGIPTLLAASAQAAQALAGQDVGTWFDRTGHRKPTRLLWLAHAADPRGRLVIDCGAVRALTRKGASLLAAGVTRVDGDFEAGEPVDVCDENGHMVARGLVNYSSEELPGLLGRSTTDLVAEYGPGYDRELVHRDSLVLITGG